MFNWSLQESLQVWERPLQQLHKTLGYISWALDQKTNLQPLRIHLHSFILQGQKLLPLQTELTHRLGCSACWSISEGVFKSSSQTAAQRLLGGSEREGNEGGAPTPLEIRHHIPNSSLEDNEKGGCRAKQHCSAGWWCHPPIHIWTQRPCPCLDTKVGEEERLKSSSLFCFPSGEGGTTRQQVTWLT